MVWLKLAYLLAAMTVCSVGAGIGIARRMVREPKLVLVASVAIGGILLYLAAGIIYVSNISWQWSYLVTAVCAIALLWEWREIWRWCRDPEARSLLYGWLLLGLWILLADMEIRNFALWIGDWFEHYQRALYFLQHWALNRQVYGHYAITARPPMMNLLQALFMAQVGHAFEFYEAASSFLNLTIYLAVAAIASEWGGKHMAMLTAGVMALSPWFVQNATYPWTKLYCAFYVVAGVWFYWRWLRRGEEIPAESAGQKYRIMAYLMLTAGSLVHYTAVIAAIFVAIDDLVRERRRWRELICLWAMSAILFATWALWAGMHFGPKSLVAATTTATEAERHGDASLVENFALNGTYSLVPRAISNPRDTIAIARSDEFFTVKLRDLLFFCYEPGLVLAWGAGGLAAMAWALSSDGKEKFWVLFCVWLYVGELLVCTPQGFYWGGVAQVLFQPLVWLGMAWLLGASERMPRWVRRVWQWGILLDGLWVMLHLGLEGQVLDYVQMPGGYEPADLRMASHATFDNGLVALTHNLRFLGMETILSDTLVFTAIVCGGLAWWWSVRRRFLVMEKRAATLPP